MLLSPRFSSIQPLAPSSSCYFLAQFPSMQSELSIGSISQPGLQQSRSRRLSSPLPMCFLLRPHWVRYRLLSHLAWRPSSLQCMLYHLPRYKRLRRAFYLLHRHQHRVCHLTICKILVHSFNFLAIIPHKFCHHSKHRDHSH